MPYLLDTSTLLWYFDETSNLSKTAKSILSDLESNCFVSYISLFEMAIKSNIGKLDLSLSIKEYENGLTENGFSMLQIKSEHLEFYKDLPNFSNHKDPFDRLLISTAAVENLSIISKDTKFNLYEKLVKTVW